MSPDLPIFENYPIPLLIVHHRHEQYQNVLNQLDSRFSVSSIDFRDPLPFSQHPAEILMCWKIQDNLIDALPNLKWIAALSAGVDHLLPYRQKLKSALITRAKGTMGQFLSEYALQHTLNHIRNLPTLLNQQINAQWRFVPGTLLSRITVGIYGAGSLGNEVACLFKTLGSRVLGLKRSVFPENPKQLAYYDGLYPPSELKEMASQSDVHIILLPDTASTKELFDHDSINSFKPGSLLINIGRGSLLSDDLILNALDVGIFKHAVLDVFTEEPLSGKHHFWSHPQITVTPHCAGPSEEDSLIREFIDQFESIISNKMPERIFDFDKGY